MDPNDARTERLHARVRELEAALRAVRPQEVVCWPNLGDIWAPLDAGEQARIIDEALKGADHEETT